MRDWKKLDAFRLADEAALAVLRAMKDMPQHQRYVLTSQIERAAVSIASNIVEGCARHTESEYIRFLDIAYGSACELGYQLSLAVRLHYIQQTDYDQLADLVQQTSKTLNGLIRALRSRQPAEA